MVYRPVCHKYGSCPSNKEGFCMSSSSCGFQGFKPKKKRLGRNKNA